MYVDIVRVVLEEAVATFALDYDIPVKTVLKKIREHIENTAKEHQTDEPAIQYRDPLCRLGYLYRHATANATLFEWVVKCSSRLRDKVIKAAGGELRVCSIGGGPGTELLGLAKFLLSSGSDFPKQIIFDVLDNVAQWAETWEQLADAVAKELAAKMKNPPAIVGRFLQFDVLSSDSYKDLAYKFRKTDIVIFNYLFSENKARLKDAKAVIQHLAKVTPKGCVFIVIDRLERNRQFSDDVIEMFSEAGARQVKINEFGGVLDGDEQTSDMGIVLNKMLGSPRVKFFTDAYRYPTVFWFVVLKK